MDCNSCSRNAHYNSRDGRNIVSGGMSSGRSNCSNMMQNRNSCGNMNPTRNNGCNRNQMRNNCKSTNQSRNNRSDGCNKKMEPVDEMMPAMSYVPWQQWEDIYCMEEGFERGTIFAQLDKEYIGRQGK